MFNLLKWSNEAIAKASALSIVTAAIRSAIDPAPPLAITGIFAAEAILANKFRS